MPSNLPSNKTQCPSCFTIYQITEAQLAQSKGNVRCGNCHERFKAQLLSDDQIQDARRKISATNDLFAPEDVTTAASPVPTADSDNLDTRGAKQGIESSTKTDPTTPLDKADNKGSFAQSDKQLDKPVSEKFKDGIDQPRQELSLEKRELERTPNGKSDKTRKLERQDPVFSFELEDSELSLPGSADEARYEPDLEDSENETDFEFSGIDLDFNPTTDGERAPKIGIQSGPDSENQELINEIDRIIDDRLGRGSAQTPTSTTTSKLTDQANKPPQQREPVKAINWGDEIALDSLKEKSQNHYEEDSELLWAEDDDLFIEPSDHKAKQRFGFGSLLKLLLSLGFFVLLILCFAYQVWLKQFNFVSDNETVQTNLNAVLLPVLDYLDDRGYKLPRPSNLSGIALISAVSEPHPSRASTTLMRVSFLNRSSVEQSLPWIELTLTDEGGKVVARRALKPEDYLFNNSTQANIGPHELKKVTIEMLAFPKMATGFELKMLESNAH